MKKTKQIVTIFAALALAVTADCRLQVPRPKRQEVMNLPELQ